MTFDYTRKERVIGKAEMIGTSMSREEFWNAVEGHHKRGDAVTAREFEVALPDCIPEKDAIKLAKDFARDIANHYGVVADVAIHRSAARDKDHKVVHEKNLHAHILVSACYVKDEVLGKKVAELDPIHCQKNHMENAAEVLRPHWEVRFNQALERAGVMERVDHRSFEKREIDREPTIHEGKGVWAEQNQAENDRIRERNAIKDRLEELLRRSSELEKELETVMAKAREVLNGGSKAADRGTNPRGRGAEGGEKETALGSGHGGPPGEGSGRSGSEILEAIERRNRELSDTDRAIESHHQPEPERSPGAGRGKHQEHEPEHEVDEERGGRGRDRGDDFDRGL
jgi:hypothetical protein